MMLTTLAYGIYLVVVITFWLMFLPLMLVVLLSFGLGTEGGCRQVCHAAQSGDQSIRTEAVRKR